MLSVWVLALVAVANAAFYEELVTRVVPEVKSKTSLWQAGYNPYFAGMTKEQVMSRLGTKLNYKPGPERYVEVKDGLPATFDARQQWTSCTNIGFIRDQANCGSCWAVAAAETATDRTCVATGQNVYLSDEDILACVTGQDQGCDGGYPIDAMTYWQNTGVVTGGPFGSNQGCQPYSIKPCPPQGCNSDAATPKCKKTCITGYNTPYLQDKHKSNSGYYVKGGVSSMQQEIFTNGPIEVAFSVYEDFMSYSSGIYTHTSGGLLGGHAVKAIGWGTDNGVDYWLVANSWNTTWGMQGYFKIRRGTNECGIEAQPVAGIAAGGATPTPYTGPPMSTTMAPPTSSPGQCTFNIRTAPKQTLCFITVDSLQQTQLTATNVNDCCAQCMAGNYNRCQFAEQSCVGFTWDHVESGQCEKYGQPYVTIDNPDINGDVSGCVKGKCQ